MKKTNIILAALVASVAVIACNGGSSSSSGPAGPNVNVLTVPAGFTAGTTVGTGSPVLWNAAAGSIALPTASGYNVVTLPTDVAQAISNAGASNAVISGVNNGTIIISLPTVTYAVTPTMGGSSAKDSSSTAESYNVILANVDSDIIQIESIPALAVPAGLVYGYNESGNHDLVITTPNSGSAVTAAVPLTGCGLSNNDEVTQLTPAFYNGNSFLGLGSAAGVVCVLQGSSAQWANMSESAAATGRYSANTVNNLGFFSSGTSLLGFWTIESTASVQNTVYQVNGLFTNGNYIGQAFYNISTNGQQKGNSTSTLTVANAPAVITSTSTDANGNLWAGSTGGKVYVLRTGTGGQWTSTQISGATGNTTVYTTGGTGVSVTVAGSTTVYSAQ